MKSCRIVFPAVLAAMAVLASSVQAALVLDYKFNEVAGNAIDSSASGFNGTLVNSGQITRGVAGRAAGGLAYSFAGGQSGSNGGAVSTGQTANAFNMVGGTANWTAVGWVKLSNTTNDNMVFGQDLNSAGLHAGFRGSNPYFGTWSADLGAGGSTVSSGTWYQVAYRMSGGNTQSIFLNGVLDAGPTNAGNNISNNTLFVGRNSAGDGDFAGAIDEAAIFNTALNDKQIAALSFAGDGTKYKYDVDQISKLIDLFNAGSGTVIIGKTPWRFDSTVASNVFDTSPGGAGKLLLAGAGTGGVRVGFATDLPEPSTYAIGSLMLLVGVGYAWRMRNIKRLVAAV